MKIGKCFELNENEKTTYQNLCNVAEECLGGNL